MRLAHGWRLTVAADVPAAAVRDFVRPAVRAVPRAMAARLGACGVTLAAELDAAAASRWIESAGGVGIAVATAEVEAHDIAMEILLCVGQALWARLRGPERDAWWRVLDGEIRAGVEGEIDEEALARKRDLLASAAAARSDALLERYGRASFAGTAAEYAHCLWHQVTLREGPEYLPGAVLRRRLELLARWFPADRGYRLFARRGQGAT